MIRQQQSEEEISGYRPQLSHSHSSVGLYDVGRAVDLKFVSDVQQRPHRNFKAKTAVGRVLIDSSSLSASLRYNFLCGGVARAAQPFRSGG